MDTYGEYIDRMAWNMICAKLAESKQRIGTIYSIRMRPRGYGKTMSTRALYRAITTRFSDECKIISVRWCEYFEIPYYRRRKNYIVYLAKK